MRNTSQLSKNPEVKSYGIAKFLSWRDGTNNDSVMHRIALHDCIANLVSWQDGSDNNSFMLQASVRDNTNFRGRIVTWRGNFDGSATSISVKWYLEARMRVSHDPLDVHCRNSS